MKVAAKPGAAVVHKAEPARVDERLMKPGKYEVSDDSKFTVKLHMRQVTPGRWKMVSVEEEGGSVEEVVFRMWTFDEMVEMRKMATSFDQIRRTYLVDYDALNRLKVQRLMMSWTLDRDNPRLKLHHVNGVLTDESWAVFSKRLLPAIAQHIIDEMNQVYERGG